MNDQYTDPIAYSLKAYRDAEKLRLEVFAVLRLGENRGRWLVCADSNRRVSQHVHWFKSEVWWPGRAHDDPEPSACRLTHTDNRIVGASHYFDDPQLQSNMSPYHLCVACCAKFLEHGNREAY